MDYPFIETIAQRKNRLLAIELIEQRGAGPISLSGTFTNGSDTITAVSGDMVGVAIGGQVQGVTGITLFTAVAAADGSANTIQMSRVFGGITGDQPFVIAGATVQTPTLRLVGDPGLEINELTTRAEFLAAETTQAGYPGGGWQFDWVPGGIDGTMAYSFSPLLSMTVAAPLAGEMVYGAWIDDGVNALGRVAFSDPLPLDFVGRVFSFAVYDGYPPGLAGVEVVVA